ncbi:Gldg family protein [Agaribacter flavus]|uniref:Gldg family protein n=1 Tax=Agaribacter flavus TaxID=1902781 RepID=A0ABV7FSA2_9ALTE
MQKTFSNAFFFIVLIAVFFAATLLNNLVFKGLSVDLTENKVYSLSQGTKDMLGNLEEPINLYFFFSNDASSGMTALRDYATQVETLLKKYETLADGKINLEIIDPKAFSEAEDRAATFGLTAASLGAGGDSIYFGLAGTNALDDAMVIGFFDPSKESFLEYDISKLVHQLSQPALAKIAIVTSLALEGGQNPLTGQQDPPNVIYTQLSQLFDVELVDVTADTLPDDTQVLVLWHPQNLSEGMQYAVDQYLMNGGKALAFVDPHYESDPMASMGAMGANTSSFDLLEAYGIEIQLDKVVLDAKLGLEIRGQQNDVIRHVGFIGLGDKEIDDKDITTADLDTLNGASFGSMSLSENASLSQVPLIRSSSNTFSLGANEYAAQRIPNLLLNNASELGKETVFAARYSGTASSYYADNEEKQAEGFVKSTDNFNLVVVADADLLADRFWVQQSSFFGQTVFSPFANNGDFVTNLAENFAGSEGLIGIRSRGTFARPFEKVQALAVVAEEKFREQEQLLQSQLEQTEAQLAELQGQQSDSLTISPEQQAAIDEFVAQRVQIRKSLRDVQFQLDKDIDSLGNTLAILNIAIAPLILVTLLFLLASLLRRRAPQTQA